VHDTAENVTRFQVVNPGRSSGIVMMGLEASVDVAEAGTDVPEPGAGAPEPVVEDGLPA
jgi:hypothetical protein